MKRQRNDGIRKVCRCPRRSWSKCPHPWHFNYKWQGKHHRLSLDRHLGRHVDSKTDAKAQADALRAAIRAGQFGKSTTTPNVRERNTITLEAFGEVFLERFRPKRARNNDAWKEQSRFKLKVVNAHIFEDGQRFGAKVLSTVSEDDVEAFMLAFKSRGRAASTRNHYVQLFRDLFRWGVKKAYLVRSPLSDDCDVKREKVARRRRRLTGNEEAKLLEAAKDSPRLYRLIIAALETACRQGELLSLQWRDVDLGRKELNIRAENTKDQEHRTLPISSRLASVLEMGRTDLMGVPFGPLAYVFGDEIGRRIHSPKKAWANALTKAGIADLRFHDLRHEAGSKLVEAGWPVHHVQEMLGHADLKQTSTYLNVTLVGLKESMRKLDEERGCNLVANEEVEEPRPLCSDDTQPLGKRLVN